MTRLMELLGLAPEATEEQAIASVQAMKQSMAALVASKEVLEALGLKEGATLSEVTGTVMAMKASAGQVGEVAALRTEVATLKAQAAKREATELVAQAMQDGKVTPAQKDWAMGYAEKDPEAFKVFAAKSPVVVPMGEVAPGAGPQGQGGAADATQMAVNKAFGVSEETFKKFGPKTE